MKNRFTLKAGYRLLLLSVLTFCATSAVAEIRVWKSSSGKYEVKAELISSDGESVSIRTEDGREITIELAKLSEEDREFVAELSADTADDSLAKEDQKQVRQKLLQFYRAVERDRDGVRGFLTADGKASFDRNRAFFDDLRGPDPGERIRAGKIQIHDDALTASADYRIRLEGKSSQMQMLFVAQDSQWQVAGIVGPDPNGNGRNQMSFSDATQSKLPAGADPVLPELASASASTPSASIDLTRGSSAYATGFCAKCHGPQGAGTKRGPDLTDDQWDHCDGSTSGIRDVLVAGVSKGQLVDNTLPFGMNPAKVPEAELDALAEYVKSLGGTSD